MFALTALILTVFFLPETLARPTLTAKEKSDKKDKSYIATSIFLVKENCKLILNKQIALVVCGYCIHSFISICMYEIFPLWLMASEKSGGMAMSLGLIGTIQSINGLCLLIYQSSIFPRLAKYMPPINFWVLSGLLSVPTIIFMPFTSQFSTADTAMDFTWAAILRSIQVVFDMSIFTSSFLLINNSCDALQRGAVNGLAMTIASFTKATGPILGSVIFAWSITNEMSFPFSHHFGFFIIAILYLIQSLVVFKFFPQKLNVMKGGAIRKEGNGE